MDYVQHLNIFFLVAILISIPILKKLNAWNIFLTLWGFISKNTHQLSVLFWWLHSNMERKVNVNPIWTGLFANLKRLGEQNGPLLTWLFQIRWRWNLVRISSMGRNLYKLTKVLMTSSSCWFYDVIKMQQLKNSRFSIVSAEYLKNGSTDFQQTYVIFRQSCIEVFEIKRWNTGHSLLPR